MTRSRENWHPVAPPLPAAAGKVLQVTTVEELFDAADTVSPGDTIEIADGHYLLPTVFTIRTDDVCVRSASGDRDAVILDGNHSDHGELFAFTECHRVSVADLTIQNVLHNGFKLNANIGRSVRAIVLHNCVIRNVWQRYQRHLFVQSRVRSGNKPATNTAVENEMLALRGQQHGRGAELTFWTGFMLGGAMTLDAPNPAHAGDMYDLDSVGGADSGGDIGGSIGGGLGGDM